MVDVEIKSEQAEEKEVERCRKHFDAKSRDKKGTYKEALCASPDWGGESFFFKKRKSNSNELQRIIMT